MSVPIEVADMFVMSEYQPDPEASLDMARRMAECEWVVYDGREVRYEGSDGVVYVPRAFLGLMEKLLPGSSEFVLEMA